MNKLEEEKKNYQRTIRNNEEIQDGQKKSTQT